MAAGSKGKTVSSTTTAPSTAEVALSNDFASNKGRLPWPVSYKKVSREYGRYTHSSGGQNMNNGIDLLCDGGAAVKSVFNGTVTRVFTCPNGTKGIIVRHGEYMTVYANMGTVTVSEGKKVTTGQNLGTVYTNSDGVAEFKNTYDPTRPVTGDESHLIGWSLAALSSLAVLAYLGGRLRKRFD